MAGMEESFEVRVKRLFGSRLFEAVPQSSFPASSWSVSDGEVERREWNRDRGPGPESTDDHGSYAFAEGGSYAKSRRASDLNELDEEDDANRNERYEYDDEEGEEEKDGGDDRDSEVLEMRSFVGLDPTLDNEDEEDEYDRAALGKDSTDERLYMNDVKNPESHLSRCHSIFQDDAEKEQYFFHKDPRADHLAADMRLEEDKIAAENFPSPKHSRREEQPANIVHDCKLKPILKRKESKETHDSRPMKRVRFEASGSQAHNDEEILKDEVLTFDSHSLVGRTAAVIDPIPIMSEEFCRPVLPDYLINPTKYTYYSFGSYEGDDDLANRSAFEDFQILYKDKSNSNHLEQQQHLTMELPKFIKFNPRKKSQDDSMPAAADESGKEFLETGLWVTQPTAGIAANESDDANVCKMDEDERVVETCICDESMATSSKRERHYRSNKATILDDDF